ncbi:MAG TPA: SDR family NAD(P)-dependent oxidoreductase [Spongiibacteraceae bacterium]|jgi:NAD(P)-dependent dehydrogenase (short-subunit alcohol dehydrogenase family)|nr:SDR family oxidoreductase [Spongiibacteraceae bacterium]HUH37693.1 SDR family NAD(P)-dependent oxidoreductase [Spongiibacteraceae bacterium]
MLLKDKVVIISGIGPGLGIKLALEAARQGAKLAIAARTASKLKEAEQEIAALGLGTEVISQPTDIADRAQCKALVDATIKRFGRIDSLINSAYNPGKFEIIEKADLNDWREVMDVNLFGTMNLTLETVPHMKKQGGGAVVMVNTMVTRRPLMTQAGYGASKLALVGATQHLALELGQYGIRVNSTFMGWMWGPPVEGFMKAQEQATGVSVAEQKAAVAKNIPLGAIPEDGDCGKAAIFLASDYSCAMTGACLDVNGGEYMAH